MKKFYLYATNKCNQRCLFCVRLGKNEKLNKQPSFEDLKNQISNMPDKAKTVLFFDGGEPTLYENFLPLIEHALSVGVKKMAILTNATRFSDNRFTDELFRRFEGKDDVELSFSVSLHSHIEEISDMLTNSKGSYRLTIKGLKNLLARTNRISIYHIMTSYNYDKLEAFCSFIVERFPRIKAVNLSFIYPRGNPLEHKEIFPNFSKLKKHLLKAICFLEEHNVNVSVPVCGTIPLCAIEGHEEYVIDQLERDTAENVKLFDTLGYHDYILSEDYFHRQTKIKDAKCTRCILDSVCKGIWGVYANLYGFDGIDPIFINQCKYKIIDVNVDSDFKNLAKSLKNKRKIVILNFISENKKSPPNAGKGIENFLSSLKEAGVHFLVAAPIPKSFFENNENYERTVKNFNIPKSCKECLFLLARKADNKYSLCKNQKILVEGDLLKGKSKDGIYNEFFDKIPKICPNFPKLLQAYEDDRWSKKIEIVIGHSCNNNCKFCSIEHRHINRTTEEIKKEIDRAAKENPYELNFTGGEPTIRKDIFEILSYAKNKVKRIRMTTNGRLLYYEWFAKKLINSGLSGAIFSLHGPNAKVHDYLTSSDGSFDQLMKGMENLSKLTDDISINIVITSANYKLIPQIIKKTIDKYTTPRIGCYCLIFPTIYGKIRNNRELIPRYEDVKPYVHKALEIVRKKNRNGWVLNIPPCFLDEGEQYSGIMNLNTIMYWPKQTTDLDKKKWERKMKLEKCKKCKFDEKCPGIPKDYYLMYMSDKK